MEEECRREITSPVFTNATLRDAVARFWEDKSTAESIYGPMKCWNVGEVTDMEGLFSDAGLVGVARTSQAAFNEPIEFWVVDKVTNMKDMFKYCTNFRQRLQAWDPRRVTSMEGMFFYASAFNQDLGWCLHSSDRYWDLPLPDARTDAGPFDLARADGDARPIRRAVLNSDAAAHVLAHTNQVQGVQRRSL